MSHSPDVSRFLWAFRAGFQVDEVIFSSEQSITISLTRSPSRKERAATTRENYRGRCMRRKRAWSSSGSSRRQVVAASRVVSTSSHKLGGLHALTISHSSELTFRNRCGRELLK
jgi:hypothetical protein